jgi:hypothetical protein
MPLKGRLTTMDEITSLNPSSKVTYLKNNKTEFIFKNQNRASRFIQNKL